MLASSAALASAPKPSAIAADLAASDGLAAGKAERIRKSGLLVNVVLVLVAFTLASLWWQVELRGHDAAGAAINAAKNESRQAALYLAARSTGRRLDEEAWRDALRTLRLGRTGEVSVVSAKGEELFRTSEQRSLPLRAMTPAGQMVAAGLGDAAPFLAFDEAGEERIYALADVDRAVAHVVVSQASEEVLAEARAAKARDRRWAAQASVILGLTTVILLGFARRHRNLKGALACTQAQNSALIARLGQESAKAHQLAYFDQLTGLANRSYFLLLAGDRLAGARRRTSGSAVLLIDLDRFKSVNDTFGRQAGDQLLIEVAERLRASLRQADLVARLNGDQFVVQATDLARPEDLVHLARKVIDAVGRPLLAKGQQIVIRPSIGIAIDAQDGDTLDLLLRNADAAMYEAKKSGGGVYRFFDAQLDARARRRSELEQQLLRAIDNGEFVIHYQPRLATDGYRIVTLEALVRWQHPQHGLIFPGDFIPQAEENGSIVQLGAHVVRRVCAQLAGWRERGLTPPPVAVNASARQLRDDGFARLIRNAVSENGLGPAMLEIEVTESCVMEDPKVSAAILGQLVGQGIRVSLDDFGTGYSSLSSLKRLPLSAIKIDRSFVADIGARGASPNDDVIVASTISMGHGLGLRMVAEGVETAEQLERLRALGCEEVQGYLFSRPLPAAQVEGLLREGCCPPG